MAQNLLISESLKFQPKTTCTSINTTASQSIFRSHYFPRHLLDHSSSRVYANGVGLGFERNRNLICNHRLPFVWRSKAQRSETVRVHLHEGADGDASAPRTAPTCRTEQHLYPVWIRSEIMCIQHDREQRIHRAPDTCRLLLNMIIIYSLFYFLTKNYRRIWA